MSDMRLVLLGYRRAGKSSTGNTILGREEFGTSRRTAECVKREGEAEGRHITLVEAPGWIKNHTVLKTPDHDKREIAFSLSLCPPGPHAVLLVINVSLSFRETHQIAARQHMELLGEAVWSKTVLLFTRGDWLGNTSIEQHIESGGEALRWLVEKCGNRYFVIENNRRDGNQVIDLLDGIDKMMAGETNSLFRVKGTMDPPEEARIPIPEPKKPGDYRGAVVPVYSSFLGRRGPEGSTRPVEMVAGIQRTRAQTCTPMKSENGRCSKEEVTKSPFVDPSEILVQYNECIGTGSFGKVYQGSYKGVTAAVKVLMIGDASAISNEFLVPLRLSHPNIVRMMAVAKTETEILIANEYIHGANLHQVLHKDTGIQLQDGDKMFVALDIALAVQYIHSKRIIHQDLKPSNIMIAAGNKRAYLMDWGLANWKETMLMTRGSHRTSVQYGPQGGTVPYMAPECLVDCEDCSPQSDMWSLGITLLEMFTNTQPWECGKVQELRRFLKNKQLPHAMGALQPPNDTTVKRLLLYEPKDRITATDLVALLKSKIHLTNRREQP